MMLKSYKYRIYHDQDQIRFVYNYGLERKIKEYNKNKKFICLV